VSFYTIDASFRPIEQWPGKRTPYYNQKRAPFKATVGKTQAELQRELRHLRAKNVIIQLDTDSSQIRQDGYPRSNARVNGSAIILTFDTPDHGTLSYPCDTYDKWESNLRAIVLTLEHLRAVERYGVNRNGEHYKGSAQQKVHAQGASGGPLSLEGAAAIYARMGGGNANDILRDAQYAKDIYYKAARVTHPDVGGTTAEFQALQAARALIDKHFGGAP
jgi:hypothetical protein